MVSAASDTLLFATVASGAVSAATIDVFTRRIPNALTLGLTVTGMLLAASGASGLSLGASLLGFVAGFVLMLPGHLLGGTGAGDVKLLAAIGAVVGPRMVFTAFLLTAVAGGVLALGFAIARGQLSGTLRRTARLAVNPRDARFEIEARPARSSFPYGPAIAIGSVLAVVIRSTP